MLARPITALFPNPGLSCRCLKLPTRSDEYGAMIDSPPEQSTQEELPVLPLREFVLFPYMVLPLFVARESSMAAVEDALAGERLLLLVAQRDPEIDDPDPDDL